MKYLLFFSLLITSVLTGFSQTIDGDIYSSLDSSAIPGVTIRISGSHAGTFSDLNGHFSIRFNAGDSLKLELTSIGYETEFVRVVGGQKNLLKIYLDPANYQKDEVVLSSTRANRNTATAFTNVDLEKIEARNFGQDVPYLLEMEPSVVVTSDAGAGVGYTGIRIRGVDPTRINVTINGVPYNDSESQGTFWVDLPDFASNIDNIQVQRGVGTSSNGGAAFGASLNLSTNKLTIDPYATVINGYGSFNTRRHTISAGSGLLGKYFSIDARLSNIASDGYIDRATSDLKSYYISGAFHGKKSLLRFNMFSGLEETYQAWNGVPEHLLDTNRTFNSATYENEVDHYQQDHYQAIYSQDLGDGFNLNFTGFYSRGRGYFEQFKTQETLTEYGLNDQIIGGDTISTTDLIRRRWLDNHFYGFVFAANYHSGKRLSATIGGGWNQYQGAHYGEVIWAQYASNGAIRHRYYDEDATKNDLNIYAKLNYFVHAKVSLFADVQFRKIDYTLVTPFVQENEDITEEEQTLRWAFVNPKIGVNYEVDSKNRIYGSFAIGSREPTRADLRDATQFSRPTAEYLLDTEVGYQRQTTKYKFGANLYWMRYRDQLVLSGKINDVGAYTRINVDQSDRYGIEVDWAWNIHKKLRWGANFTFSQNKIQDFVESIDNYDTGIQDTIAHGTTDISFSPNYIAGSELVYEPVKNLTIALITKYVGEQFLDNTSNEDRMLDDYILNNIRLHYAFSWKFFKEIGIGVQFNNVLNELYESNGYTFSYTWGGEKTTENFYYPQAGFNFMTNLTLKF